MKNCIGYRYQENGGTGTKISGISILGSGTDRAKMWYRYQEKSGTGINIKSWQNRNLGTRSKKSGIGTNRVILGDFQHFEG